MPGSKDKGLKDESSEDESSEEGNSAQSKESKKEREEESQDSGTDGEESSTESKSRSQTKMSTTFDAKLEYLLTIYLSAISDQHDIQQAFIHKGILTFENFTDMCCLENLKQMKWQSGTNLVEAFTSGKLKLISDVLIYYKFLMNDNQKVLAEDPVSWVKSDFRDWKRRP